MPFDSKKADIWALGICLFKMVFGKAPFKANTEKELILKTIKGKIWQEVGITDC